MLPRVQAVIDLSAVRHNVGLIRAVVGPGVEIMAVVKADAYGHGAREAAGAAMQAGASWLGVATVKEGAALRQDARDARICVLSPFGRDECDDIAVNRLTPLLSDRESACALSAAAGRLGTPVEAHIEVDTGMGRSGVPHDRAADLVRQVSSLPFINLTGMSTHFPSAEDDTEFTARQLALFEGVRAAIAQAGIQLDALHAANSAALLRYPAARYNLVRPGLLLYGIVPECTGAEDALDIHPALTLQSAVRLIRELPAGHTISYGQTHILTRPSRVATVPVGYGDGYPRALSGRGHVLVRGRRAPILGRICMDVMVIDVTDIPNVEVGGSVVLIGKQGDQRIRVEELARLAETTEHDVTTRLTDRVERAYIS
jgi:alanine racemase